MLDEVIKDVTVSNFDIILRYNPIKFAFSSLQSIQNLNCIRAGLVEMLLLSLRCLVLNIPSGFLSYLSGSISSGQKDRSDILAAMGVRSEQLQLSTAFVRNDNRTNIMTHLNLKKFY